LVIYQASRSLCSLLLQAIHQKSAGDAAPT
jgi:hypothetical protein